MRNFAASIALLMAASTVLAGPDWTEGLSGEATDARKNPPGQLVTFPLRGVQIETIQGGLNGADIAGGPDIADVYQLTTVVPGTRVSSGDLMATREANFDTLIALFTMNGLGIVANDDVSEFDNSSAITIATPGTYLVAIAVKGMQPVSTGGNIFNFTQPGAQFQQVPANGPGAGQPLADWNGTPVQGEPRNYILRFKAAGVPTLSETGLMVLGSAFVIGAVWFIRRGSIVG
jgi:hypothetical protein